LLLVVVLLLSLGSRVSTTPYEFPDLNSFPPMPVSEKNPVTKEGAELGRFLFYDPLLSSDSSTSCSSCHNQKNAFSDAPKQFSVGVNNISTARNAMPLFNLAWSPSFFYDGRISTVEDQISHPINAKGEMNMDWQILVKRLNSSKFYSNKFKKLWGRKIDSTMVKNAIAQFLRTLISYQSKFDKATKGELQFTKEEFNGFLLMNNQIKGDCQHCHPTDGNQLLTTLKFSNNGLDSIFEAKNYKDKGRGGITRNEKDNGKFLIPSLRNIGLTAPYMHDGRFKTLEDVLDFYSSGVHVSANIDSKMGYAYQGGVKLTSVEKKEIMAFLNTLTDSVFISKKEFSNPFLN